MKGFYIVIEGIDGTGKHTIINGLLKSYLFKHLKVLDLVEYWKKDYKKVQKDLEPHTPSWLRAFFVPPDKMISEADIITTCEPTYGLVGAGIRGIGIHKESKGKLSHGCYPANTLSQLYALDRLFLRKEIVEPALKLGKFVIQSRNEASSLIYEYRHEIREKPSLNHDDVIKKLVELEGNTAGLLCPPDVMLIQFFEDVYKIEERFRGREKDAFEDLAFQKDLSEFYSTKPFLFGKTLAEFYSFKGSRVEFIEATLDKKDVLTKSIKIIEEEISYRLKAQPKDMKPLFEYFKTN